MVALQIISKVLQTSDNSIIENNLLDEQYFVGYEEEFNFIQEHVKKYGNVPDKETFLKHFSDDNGNPTIELVEVNESDRYLIDTIREEYLFYKSVPVVQRIGELMNTDANAAVEYMISAMKDLQPNYQLGGVDIINEAGVRYEEWVERKNNPNDWFFTCGFPELDDLWHGLQRGEEFVVIVARTNQGKSWVLEKMTTHIWQLGFNVGYISPEMGPNSIGYRFDTLYKNFSNSSLAWGKADIEEVEYQKYTEELKKKTNKFLVATPTADFDRKITVSKLRNWVKQNKLDMIAIDGITYLTDERYKRGDNKTTSLTNISEDLMALSVELKIPVLVVAQVNRNGVGGDDENTPELESIRDSDGIAYNASKVLSIRQLKNNTLLMQIKKQRIGSVGGKLNYNWDINTGVFTFMPAYDDAEPEEKTERKVKEIKKQYKDKEDVF